MSIIGSLERTRFFVGRLLTTDDLDREQAYFLARSRRHNRFLHGWGVVAGLEVSVSEANEVVVAPGLAIDCAGNEIAVEECVRISIGPTKAALYVAIRYRETEVEPVPVAEGMEFSRIREGAEVVLLEVNPSAKHRGIGPGTPGCGQAHALCLAKLKWHQSKWKLIQRLGIRHAY